MPALILLALIFLGPLFFGALVLGASTTTAAFVACAFWPGVFIAWCIAIVLLDARDNRRSRKLAAKRRAERVAGDPPRGRLSR